MKKKKRFKETKKSPVKKQGQQARSPGIHPRHMKQIPKSLNRIVTIFRPANFSWKKKTSKEERQAA